MQPINFQGAREIKKPANMTDEQCSSIFADSGVDDDGFPFFLTAWELSDKDKAAILRGEPIYVKTVATGLPPMCLFTLDETGTINI